jgi:hypothetical protein
MWVFELFFQAYWSENTACDRKVTITFYVHSAASHKRHGVEENNDLPELVKFSSNAYIHIAMPVTNIHQETPWEANSRSADKELLAF